MKWIRNIGFAVLSALLAACGGAPGSYSDGVSPADKYSTEAPPPAERYGEQGGAANDGAGGGNNDGNTGGDPGNGASAPNENLEYLDCSSLDPRRIYLKGSFTPPGETPVLALIDVEDPDVFCVGLPAATNYHISEKGELYYNSPFVSFEVPNRIYRFIPDKLGVSSESLWSYPISGEENDILITSIRSDTLVMSMSNGEPIVYYVDALDYSAIYSSSTELPLAQLEYPLDVYGVTPDESLLLRLDATTLWVLDADRNLVEVPYPMEGQWSLVGKPRLQAGGNAMWILARNDTGEERRWSLNLGSLTISDDGAFADVPDHVEEYYFGTATEIFDGNGDLIQLAYINYDPPVGDPFFVVRRFLRSSGGGSKILRDDTNENISFDEFWNRSPIPYVFTTSSGDLITGY